MMHSSGIVFWCYVFLFVVSSLMSRGNSMNDDERSDNTTVRYDFLVNSMRDRDDEMKSMQYNLRENSIKNDYEMQYESRINFTKNDRKNDNTIWYESREYIMKIGEKMKPHATLTFQDIMKVEGESNSLSYELYGNSNTNDSNNNITIVPNEACDNGICVQLCCPFGDSLRRHEECVAEQGNYSFPNIYRFKNDSEDKTFQVTVRDPCVLQGFLYRLLQPNEYLFLMNGTLYRGPGQLIPPTSYCLAVVDQNVYDVLICSNKIEISIKIITLSTCFLVSLPFYLLTFVVYSILPEFQNMHGYTLRAYIASLFVSYVIVLFPQQMPLVVLSRYCIPLAYIFNFSFLSSFSWLNVICFDIWWTFRGVRSYRTNVNHREKKKFVMYSIYAWGVAFIHTIVCAIMAHIPDIPKNWIRPKMCKRRFWFAKETGWIYFLIPVSVTLISNICFFISTTLMILYQNKHIAHQLRDSESKCHDENKQRFIMYVKLSITMGIIGSTMYVMDIISLPINKNFIPSIIWHAMFLINALHGLIIFIISVCKKKILRLLLKRFGWQNCNVFCNISRSDDCPNTATSQFGCSGSFTSRSRTEIETGTVPMREINPSNRQSDHRAEFD